MKCLMDKSREVSYPCSHACPLFGDCVVEFETERSAGSMGGRGSSSSAGRGSSSPAGRGCGSPAGHGHSVEGIVVLERQDYNPMTNGDRVRDMCDGDLAKFFAKKVMDQVALIQLCDGRPMIGGTQLAAMKEAYARTFFSWLRSPAEEGL